MQTLRLYHDVARCRSFSEAARQHGITQSAASQRIGQLEKKLGVMLLDRSVRPLTLTDAGRVFLVGVRDVLQRYDKLERTVMVAAAEPTGRVRVSAIYSSGIDLLRQIGERFAQQHPGIAVQIDYQKPDAVHESVVTGRADVGILSYPERFKKIGVIPLRDEEMAVVCPPGHPLARHRRVEAATLCDHPMIGFDTPLPVARGTADYFKAFGRPPLVTHRFDNLDTLKNAVAATGQFAILPRRTVQAEAEAGTLCVIELTPRLVRPMGLIYHRRSASPSPLRIDEGSPAADSAARRGGWSAAMPISPPVATFIEFLLAHARADDHGSPPTPDPPADESAPARRPNPASTGSPLPAPARQPAVGTSP